jgi:hypothetical protein
MTATWRAVSRSGSPRSGNAVTSSEPARLPSPNEATSAAPALGGAPERRSERDRDDRQSAEPERAEDGGDTNAPERSRGRPARAAWR